MKRLTAFLAVLALLFCCSAAAENEKPVISEFEDFTLQTKGAPDYTGPKGEGQPLFVFFQAVTGSVSTSAVSASWIHATEPVSAAEFTGMMRNAEPGIRVQYESGGNVLAGYEVRDAFEAEYWERPLLVCDTEMLVRINDSEISLIQRCIRVTGGYGTYLFTLSAWTEDLLEEATGELVRALSWKA